MFIPTDFQLKRNVLSYNINTGRIFFIKEFWDQYSLQLIKDFRHETGVELDNKKKFFCEIKRSLFEYYFYKIDKNIDLEHSLYHQLTTIFQRHSKNDLPKLITDFKKEVPVYYDDDHILEDPVEITYDSTHYKTDSKTVSLSSISDTLYELESSHAHTMNVNKSISDEADSFLKQYLCEDDNLVKIKQDYENGVLNEYIDTLNFDTDFDDLMKITRRIFDHYKGLIGYPTIFNIFNFRDIKSGRTSMYINPRFDLWHKNYTLYDTYRQLVFYIGYDICDFLFSSFLKERRCHYCTGYEYVFLCFIFKDFEKKLSLIEDKSKHVRFIKVQEHVRENKKNANPFNSRDRSKTLFNKVPGKALLTERVSDEELDSSQNKEEVKTIGFNFGNSTSTGFGTRKNRGFFD
jgi:hypothetical protein